MSEQSEKYLQSIPARPIISGLVISRVKADGNHGNTKIEVTIAVHENQNIAADIPAICMAVDALTTSQQYSDEQIEEYREFLLKKGIDPNAESFVAKEDDWNVTAAFCGIRSHNRLIARQQAAIAFLSEYGYHEA